MMKNKFIKLFCVIKECLMQSNVRGAIAGASKTTPAIIFLHVDFKQVDFIHLFLELDVGDPGVGNVVKSFVDNT